MVRYAAWLSAAATIISLYCCLQLKKSQPPKPTPYPISFRIQFDTNVTREEQQQTQRQENRTLRSSLYYDWTIPAQRIDHPSGAYECVRFYNVHSHGCSLHFRSDGMYRVIQQDIHIEEKDSFQTCCLDLPGVGPPPPDWAQRANPTFTGLKHDAYSGYDSYEFVFDHLLNIYEVPFIGNHEHGQQLDDDNDIYDRFHTAREVHDDGILASANNNGLPLVFTFPSKAKGLQDYHFDPTSLVIGPQDRALFQLPKGCENVRCDKSLDEVITET
ncbi:expressed unknown protein [Seminavis robusta]|uniref:Uncharacterized protein n=1 Tax=Seminavis robusta TaxID=568900 RepID=A0A9N8DTE4_9STRA|nr:expressed unknown protein [Seminavis robusta]|eukprot:Sro357_g125500.1 n/a (272) ;mRNA; f:4527-5342